MTPIRINVRKVNEPLGTAPYFADILGCQD